MAQLDKMREALDQIGHRLTEDPQNLRSEMEARLIAEKGQAWYDANKRYLDAEWPLVVQLFG